MASIEMRLDRERALEYLEKLQAGETLPAIRGADDAFALIGACLFILGYSGRADPYFNGVADLHAEHREAKEADFHLALRAAASWSADLVALVAHPEGRAATAELVRAVVEPGADGSPPGYSLPVLEGVDMTVVRAIAAARGAAAG